MDIVIALASVGTGILAGSLYALSFFLQRKKAHFFFTIAFSFLRLGIFALTLYLLLLSGMIHFILFLLTFLIVFWIFVIKQKVGAHEWNQSL